jgi:hypothetical protein
MVGLNRVIGIREVCQLMEVPLSYQLLVSNTFTWPISYPLSQLYLLFGDHYWDQLLFHTCHDDLKTAIAS